LVVLDCQSNDLILMTAGSWTA